MSSTPHIASRAHLHVQVVENTAEGYSSEEAYARSLLAQEEGSQLHLLLNHDGTIIGPPPRTTRDEASFELSDLRGVSQADISVPSDRSRIQREAGPSDPSMHACGP